MSRDRYISEIIEAMRRANQMACGRLSKVSGAAVTPTQWAVLNILHERKQLSVKELARMLSVTNSAVTQLTKDLEEKGYVKRTSDPKDKRFINLSPAPKCSKMMSGIQKVFAGQCRTLFAKLSDTDLKTFAALHKKIVN